MVDKSEKKIPVIELFGPTAQGEGALCGQVSAFLRTGSCGFACDWCDSMHAVDPEQVHKNAIRLTIDELIALTCPSFFHDINQRNVRMLRDQFPTFHTPADTTKKIWMTLTGGDPCLWDLSRLVAAMRLSTYRVAVETQGQFCPDWLAQCDLVTVSPKGPSSGMISRLNHSILDHYMRIRERVVMKIVCFNEDDLKFARHMHQMYPVRMYLSSGTPQSKSTGPELQLEILKGYKTLVEQVLADPKLHDVTVLPQLHVLLWNRDLGR